MQTMKNTCIVPDMFFIVWALFGPVVWRFKMIQKHKDVIVE